MTNSFWLNICVLDSIYTTMVLQEVQKIVKLEFWGFLCSFPCYQSCEQLIDLGHQALKACLTAVTNHLGTNTMCLEKLLSSSENLDKEIGLFKPLKGVIQTVLLELEDVFDSSWNRLIKEHSATKLLLISVKNLVMVRVSCAIKLQSYRQAQRWSEGVAIKFFRVNVTGRRHFYWHCRARVVENWVGYLLRSAVNKMFIFWQ